MHLTIPAWLTGAAAALVLSAAAHALPDPTPDGSRVYLFVFRFAQNLLANFNKAQKMGPAADEIADGSKRGKGEA